MVFTIFVQLIHLCVDYEEKRSVNIYIYMYIKRNIENIEISRYTKKNSGKGLIFCEESNLFLILIQRINSKRYIMCVQVFTKPRIEEVFSFVIFNLFCD